MAKGLLQERRGERRIDNFERPHDGPEFIKIDQAHERIGRRLGQDQHRLTRSHRGGERPRLTAVNERRLDAEPSRGCLQEHLGARVDLSLGYDVIPGGTQRQDHRRHRAHPRCKRERCFGPFKRSDCLLERGHGRVGESAVEASDPRPDGGLAGVVERGTGPHR